MSTQDLFDKLDKRDKNGRLIIPTHNDLCGYPICPKCGLNLSKYQDMWEVFGGANVQIDTEYVEVKINCPGYIYHNGDEDDEELCDAELILHYSRYDVEMVEDEKEK